MKMSKQHLDQLGGMLAKIPHHGCMAMAYQRDGLRHERYRWDLLWYCNDDERTAWLAEVHATGCNDDHIDTALRELLGDTY